VLELVAAAVAAAEVVQGVVVVVVGVCGGLGQLVGGAAELMAVAAAADAVVVEPMGVVGCLLIWEGVGCGCLELRRSHQGDARVAAAAIQAGEEAAEEVGEEEAGLGAADVVVRAAQGLGSPVLPMVAAHLAVLWAKGVVLAAV
jgi:hypothetical protein